MKKALQGLTVTAALLAALSASSMAATEGLPERPPRGPFGDRILKRLSELGLSPEQQQQVKTIIKHDAATARPLVQQLVAERRQLRSVIEADLVDETAIRAQSAKVAAVEADLAVNRAKVSQQIRAVLTPEQRQKAKEMAKEADKQAERFMHDGPFRPQHHGP